jgi:hypothetical protein
MTAKTRAIPSSHRDKFATKAPGQVAGWLRQVTQTPFIAGPLALSINNKPQISYEKKNLLS